jgi:outer membrane protein insertion porin family
MRPGVLILALLICAAPRAFAQPAPENYAGRPVTGVRIFVDRQPSTDPALVDLVETRAGQPLSMAAVRESITHLFTLGRFQDVQVDAVEANGGVELRYTLVPVQVVERVEFRGTRGLSEGTLRDAVTQRFGRTPQLTRAREVLATLSAVYQDHGYFKASIRPEPESRPGGTGTILVFAIDAGPRAAIGKVDVEGNPPESQQNVLARLGLLPGRPYDRERIDQRIADYTKRLKSRGHFRAAVTETPRISEDGRVADLTIVVDPGPLVTVRFEGDPLPADRRDDFAPFEREGSVDTDLIEDSVEHIRQYLQQQGFWKAEVASRLQENGDTLTIVFTVRKGSLYRVAPDGVRISGNTALSTEETRPLIVLEPGDPYVSALLDATVGALQRLYRTRGFRWAEVKPAEEPVTENGATLIRPSIEIVEGPRAAIGDIVITGANALSEAEIRRFMQLQTGSPYYEPAITAGRDAVQVEYLNLGYTAADVKLTPGVSADRGRVDLTVAVTEGPQTIVDHVIIVGNRRTEDDIIRKALLLQVGAPLGLRDLLESRRRLSALGLFRRIDIRPIEHGPPTRRDVLVTVEEAPATTVAYGGGLEATRRLRGDGEEQLEFAPRGFFDIGRRNLGGKNRSINLLTRTSLRPRDDPDDPERDGRGFGFSEYRVVGIYREPGALVWNADLTLTAAVEQGVRSSFNFARKGVTADAVRRLTPTIRTSTRYSFSTTRTFDVRLSDEEQAQIDRLFPQVRLSAVSAAVARDTRDDVAEPSRGTFVSGEASIASRALGGQVGFLKTYMQGFWFKQLPGARRAIFATRAAAGLADGFPREAQPTDADGRPIEGPPIVIEDLPASERFFAGGDTTIRGFALDTVGAPNTITERGFPRGGNSVLILNAELRVPVWKEIGAAVFTDGGNVFNRVTDFTFTELRGSVGFGVRYRSPIGPVRVDVGFKMDRRESESRSVLHFSIGQAF